MVTRVTPNMDANLRWLSFRARLSCRSSCPVIARFFRSLSISSSRHLGLDCIFYQPSISLAVHVLPAIPIHLVSPLILSSLDRDPFDMPQVYENYHNFHLL